MPTAKIKFKPAEKKLIQTRIGGCFFSDNVASLPSLTPLAAQLGLSSYFYVDLTGTINDAQAATINTFLKATGAKIGVYVPIRYDNYLEYTAWLIKVFGDQIEFLQMDMERMDISNDEYITRCRTLMHTYPLRVFSWNAGLIVKDDSQSKAINALIKQQVGTTTYGRQYEHLSDRCKWTTNQVSNLVAINNYFGAELPKINQEFKTETGLTKQIIEQWNEYFDAELVSAPLINIAIGEMGRYKLNNTDSYPYFYRQSITNLIVRGEITPNYTSIKRITNAIKFKYIVPVTNSLPVSVVGLSDGDKNFGLLIINQNSIEIPMTATDIKVPSKTTVPSFIVDSGYADTIDSTQRNELFTASTFTIRKNSVSCITFATTTP